jgi:hypothetical protein
MKLKTALYGALFAAAISQSAFAGEGNMGDHQWVCQVTTPSNVFGFVDIWADTREIAQDVAQRAKAYTVNHTWEPAQNVIECVKFGEEMFRDKEFWTFFERTPR